MAIDEIKRKVEMIGIFGELNLIGALLNDVRELRNYLKEYEKAFKDKVKTGYDHLVKLGYIRKGSHLDLEDVEIWITPKKEKTVSTWLFKKAIEEVPEEIVKLYRNGIIEVRGQEKAEKFVETISNKIELPKNIKSVIPGKTYESVYVRRVDEGYVEELKRTLDQELFENYLREL